jgi:tetratricopeptide (TPR) repeat protein
MLKFDGKAGLKPFEKSAIVLLWVRCLVGMGEHKQALSVCEFNKKVILDDVEFHEICGNLQLEIGNKKDAVKSYEALLALNPANFDTYYHLIDAAKGKVTFMADNKPNLASAKFSAEDEALFLETLEFYQTKYPRINAPTRIAMKISRGDAFKNYLHFFVKALLIKGAPSVMTDLKELYADKEKV